MTVALGFVHRDGVTLCADTEATGNDNRKLHISKLANFETPVGRFGVVFAGNSSNAISTIQKIQDKLTRSHSSQPLMVVEHVLDTQYRRLVYDTPKALWAAHDFDLIIAHQPPRGRVAMYVSEGVSLREETDYAAAGIAANFARQMIDQFRLGVVTQSNFLTLGSYVLGASKRYMTQVGGMSLFIDFGNDGSESHFYDDPYLKAQEESFGVIQMFSLQLAIQMADPALSDQDFEMNLHVFDRKMRERREKWVDAKSFHLQHSAAYKLIEDCLLDSSC